MSFANFILSVAGVFYRGFVLMMLYNWIVAVHFGVAEIPYVVAMGVVFLSSVVVGNKANKAIIHYVQNSMDEKDNKFYDMSMNISVIAVYTIILLAGYVLQFFV